MKSTTRLQQYTKTMFEPWKTKVSTQVNYGVPAAAKRKRSTPEPPFEIRRSDECDVCLDRAPNVQGCASCTARLCRDCSSAIAERAESIEHMRCPVCRQPESFGASRPELVLEPRPKRRRTRPVDEIHPRRLRAQVSEVAPQRTAHYLDRLRAYIRSRFI